MKLLKPYLEVFRKGTSSSHDKVTNERIILSNIIYLTVALVTAIGYVIDYEIFLQPISSILFDQISSFILLLVAIFCYYLNTKNYFNVSKLIFTCSWLLLSFYINPFIQGTSEDYFFHYDEAILYISILIQILFSSKREPVAYSILVFFTFFTIVFHQKYLLHFSDVTYLSSLIEQDRYIQLIPIYYWFLFNLTVAYVIMVYERSHKYLVLKNLGYEKLNESLEKLVDERTQRLQEKQEDLEITSAQLRASQEKYRDFIHNSFEGVARIELIQPMDLDISPDDQVEFLLSNQFIAECNESFARMYGFKASTEVVGKSLKDIADDVEGQKSLMRELIGSSYEIENLQTLEMLEKKQKSFLNFIKSTVIKNKLYSFWITKIDITQRIDAQREKEKLLKDLEEYAFITSHEIRRPLANLMAISNILSDDKIEKDWPTMLNFLRVSADELDVLIRKMAETLSRTSYYERK